MTPDATPEQSPILLLCSGTTKLSHRALQFHPPFLKFPCKRNVKKPRKGEINIFSYALRNARFGAEIHIR
jgi:hypothetical protein